MAQAPPIVTASGLNKAYAERVVLRDAELSISEREKVGIVGDNGVGKSTLVRILAGKEDADSGTISKKRDARLLTLEQAPVFPGELSAKEIALGGLAQWKTALHRYEELSVRITTNAGSADDIAAQAEAAEDVERLGGWDQEHQALALLDRLGLSAADQKFSTLSGGERRRVALARVLIAKPDLAILDEPTNHLDTDTIDWLEEYLLNVHRGAVLLVTHDRYLLNRVAERTLEVADGKVHAYVGGYERYLEQKAERLALAERTERNRQNFLRRELEWLQRQPKARGTKQKARVERAKNAVTEKAPIASKAPTFELSKARAGKTILEVKNLVVKIEERTLVDDLTLFVTEGMRLGIVGKSGSGKTTLLRTLLGQRETDGGNIRLGANTRIAYFDQERSGLRNDENVFENVIGNESRIELGDRPIEARSYLERFGFSGTDQRKLVGSLSGGERARVAMARLLKTAANLIVLDEPTNDLDVRTLSSLESLLVDHKVTALVVTHDRWFLDRVATSVLAFEEDGAVTLYAGNYGDYRRQSSARRKTIPTVQSDASRPTPISRSQGPKKKAKLSYHESRELAKLPERIEKADAFLAKLNEKLADPENYGDPTGQKMAHLSRKLDAAKSELDQLMARWEELELKKEESAS